MAGTQIRDIIPQFFPPSWTNDSPSTPSNPTGGVTGRFIYVQGLQLDLLLDKLTQGILASIPGQGPPSAIPYLAHDLQLVQGPGEPNSSFTQRLQGAPQAWQQSGSNRAVMGQLVPYLTGYIATPAKSWLPIISTVGGASARSWSWYTSADPASGPGQTYVDPSGEWQWDGQEATKYWRNWLVLYSRIGTAVYSGTAASIGSASGNFFTVSGLAGLASTFTVASQPAYITISGAASAANNGTFQCTAWISPTSATVAMPGGVASDANNGSIVWSIAYFQGLQPMPVWGFPGVVWGGNTNFAWGVQVPGAANSVDVPGYMRGMRAVLGTWKNSQVWYTSIIIDFSVTGLWDEFSPWLTPGSGNPSGNTWGELGGANVGGVWQTARLTNAQFSAFNAFCVGTANYAGTVVSFGGT